MVSIHKEPKRAFSCRVRGGNIGSHHRPGDANPQIPNGSSHVPPFDRGDNPMVVPTSAGGGAGNKRGDTNNSMDRSGVNARGHSRQEDRRRGHFRGANEATYCEQEGGGSSFSTSSKPKKISDLQRSNPKRERSSTEQLNVSKPIPSYLFPIRLRLETNTYNILANNCINTLNSMFRGPAAALATNEPRFKHHENQTIILQYLKRNASIHPITAYRSSQNPTTQSVQLSTKFSMTCNQMI